MSQLFHDLDLFESISSARRAGWDKPIEKGKFHLRKRRTTVIIV